MGNEELNSQSDPQGGVHFFHFGTRKGVDIVGKQGLGNTDQIVAENRTVMFHPFLKRQPQLGA
jgi:hypothetical protein